MRVKLQPVQQSGAWVATQVRSATASISNQTVAELEGIVSDFESLSNFKVNGVGVNASGTTVVFVENDEQLDKILEVRDQLPKLRQDRKSVV